MKRLLTITVFFAVLVGGMIYATDTRVLTMGDMNTVVKDDANIFLFPSTVNYYPKMFLGEVGPRYEYYDRIDDIHSWYDEEEDEWRADTSWVVDSSMFYDVYKVGGNLAFGEGSDNPWVLGFYFSTEQYIPCLFNEYMMDNYGAPESLEDTVAFNLKKNNRITLLYGRNLGDIPFGFKFNYYKSGFENKDTGADTMNNEQKSLSRFEFGFGISPLQKKLDLAINIGLVTWKVTEWYDNVGVSDVFKPKGNMDISLVGRYWMNPMGKYVLVPHAMITYVKEGLEDYTYTQDGEGREVNYTITDKTTAFNLGLGMNYEAEEDVLLAGDFGFEYSMEKYEYKGAAATDTARDEKWTDMVLPYFKLGLDAKVLSWMDFRAGVHTQWYGRKNSSDYDHNDKRIGYVKTSTFLGGGFHWSKLTIDALIDPEFLINGPYFLTGDDTDNRYGGVAGKISLLYNF